MTSPRSWLPLLAALCFLPALADAADPALLRLKPETTDPIFVGQKLRITVDVLSSTTFGSAPAFDLPTIAGAILMKVEDRPILGTETIDGTDYTVQTHEIWFFALRSGAFSIPAFTVRFDSPPAPGQPPVELKVTSSPLAVSAKSPPGAEKLGAIVCAKDLKVEESWRPHPGETARVGDSFTRTITITASDVPAMVFPTIPPASVDGLKAYPQPPALNDHSERGEFTGQRIDTITYVCTVPGEITLPALSIPWWNLDNSKLDSAELPGVHMRVLATTKPTSAPTEKVTPSGPLPAILVTALLVAAVLAFSFRKFLRIVWNNWRHERSISEPTRFAALIRACERNNSREALDALYHWLEVTSRSSELPKAFSSLNSANCSFDSLVIELETAATLPGTQWNGAAFAAMLQHTHAEFTRVAPSRRSRCLSPLNPTAV